MRRGHVSSPAKCYHLAPLHAQALIASIGS